MNRTVIVGGHGKIALLLEKLLSERGEEVVAVIRNPDHADDVAAAGAEAAVLDVESASVEELTSVFEDADAVVFAAGAGAGSGVARKRTVDYGGSVKSAAAASLAGVRRFVQVSAIGVDDDPDPTSDDVWSAYVLAKREADDALRGTQLDWTIIRPGRLTDEAPTDRVNIGFAVAHGAIPRADVAAVIAEVLTVPESIGHAFDLVAGDVAIADAVRTASA